MASVSSVTEAAFEGSFRDSMSAGADAAAQAMERLGAKTEAAGASIEETDQRVTRSGPTWNALGKRYDEAALLADKVAQANRRLAAETEAARQAVQRGDATQAQADETVRRASVARDRSVADAEKGAERLRKSYVALNDDQAKVGASARVTGQQIAQLTPQFNDLFVQIASGQGVLMPLIQQGPQITQIFGGIGNTLRTFVATIGPARLAIGAVGLAIAGVTALANAQQGEMATLGVQLRGVAAEYGGVAAAAKASADAVARSGIGVSRSEALAVQPTLRRAAAGNQVGGLDFAAVTIQAKDLATVLGTDLEAAVGRFASAMRDPVALVDDLARQGFPSMSEGVRLSAERLRDAGKSGEGFSLVLRALQADTTGAAREGMSPFAKAAADVQTALGSIWADIKNGLSGPGAQLLTWLKEAIEEAKRFRDFNIRGREAAATADPSAPPFGATPSGRPRSLAEEIIGLNRPTAQRVPDDYRGSIDRGADIAGVDRELMYRIFALGEQSRRNPDGSWPVSPVGARGGMQVMPGTFAEMQGRYGIQGGIDNDSANAEAGARYAREMLDRFPGNVARAMAAYNAGPNRPEATLRAIEQGVYARRVTSGYEGTGLAPAPALRPADAPVRPDFDRNVGDDGRPASEAATAASRANADILDRALRIGRGDIRVTGDTREAKTESARALLGDVNAGMALAGSAEERDRLTQAQRNLNAEIERGLGPADRMIRQAAEYADQANTLSPAQAELTQKMREYDRTLREAGEAPDPAKRAEYMLQVLRGMNGPIAQAISQTRQQSDAQDLLANAYGRGAEAVGHAQNVQRAMDVIRKQSLGPVTAETAGVQELAAKYDDLTRKQNDNAQRGANDNAQRNLDYLQKQGQLIGLSADQQERELAAFQARQQAEARPGQRDEGLVQDAERLARAAVDQRSANTQLSNSWNELSRVGEQAFDRIGSAITEAFTQGGMKAVNWGNITKAVISEVIQAALKLAVINPLLNSLFGGSRGTVGGILTVAGQQYAPVGGASAGAQAGGLNLSQYGGYAEQAYAGRQLTSMFDSGPGVLDPGYNFSGGTLGRFDSFAGTNIGGTLNTPLYSTMSSPGLEGFTYVGDAAMGPVGTSSLSGASAANGTVSLGGAAAGTLGIVGGGYSIYQGIQTGGVKGGAQVVSGAAGVVAGGTALAGGSAAVGAGAAAAGIGAGASAALAAIAAAAPYIAVIAAVVALLVKGPKPTNAEQNITANTVTGTVETGGQTGEKFSQPNLDRVQGIAEGLNKIAVEVGKAAGMSAAPDVTYKVASGNRDGISFEDFSAGGGKVHRWGVDVQDGPEALARVATQAFLQGAARQSPDENVRRVIGNSSDQNKGDPEAILKDLAWYNEAYKVLTETGEKSTQFFKSMEALNAS